LHSLSQPFLLGGRDLHIGASLGITLYPDDGSSVEELVQHADTAMYHAKALGKNRYHFFTSELNARATEQLRLENDMRRGLGRTEFSLVYQPRVQLQTNKVTSCEALLRWQHPELGAIAPSVLIPIAEKSMFIQLLGREVLRQACQQAKHWQEEGQYLRVAVNVSVKQLQQGTLVSDVENALVEAGLEAKWLELEITESAAMTDVETNIVTLQTLKDMGVYISVDDFGTAYSSLNYLKRLPINSLKIDKSFVEDISDVTSTDTAIVQAVIALGNSLGFSLIAEGVEDDKQLLFLRGAGCDEAQGYYFSRPMQASDVLTWLNK
jgi:predicted signal transduction protein with EAL and GGDEF domain